MLKATTSKQNFNSIYTNVNPLKISQILIKKNKTSPCSPDKNIQMFAKKKIKHCVKNKPRIICLRKATKVKQTPNNMLFSSLIYKNLSKYNTTPTQFNSNIITNVIFDENTHYVSRFKDFLYWDDDGEFLKAFYPKKKQIEKMERILFYYTHFYSLYEIYSKYLRIGDCTKVMFKYYKNKKKIVEKDKSADTENATKNSNGNKLDNPQKNNENILSKHTKLLSISMTLSKITNPLEDIGNNKALMTTRDSSRGFLSRNTKGTIEDNNGPLGFASSELTIKSIINNMNRDEKKMKPKLVINNNNLNRLKTLKIQTKFGPPQKNKNNKNLNINLPTMKKMPQKVSPNNNCRIPKLTPANFTINSQTKIKLFSNIVNPNQKNKILQIKTNCLTERTYSNPKSSHNTCSNVKKTKGIIMSIPKSKTLKFSQPSLEKTKKQRAKIKKNGQTNNLKLNLIAMKKLVIK